MRHQSGSVSQRFARPIKQWSQRFAFLGLVAIAIAMIALSEANSTLASRLRAQVVDAFTPVLGAVSQPVETAAGWVNAVASASSLRDENNKLRAEIERLRTARIEEARLSAENQSLRGLLGAKPHVKGRHIVARVLADPSRGFVRSMLIDTGRANGVRRGLAVVNTDGLVGRITEVGNSAARALLITDINSRIAVRIERTRERAIVAGDNSPSPKLIYLSNETTVRNGDRIVTSGHDGVFPPGLPVGVVIAAGSETVRVRPFVTWRRVDFVRIIDFKPTGLVPQSAAARKGVR